MRPKASAKRVFGVFFFLGPPAAGYLVLGVIFALDRATSNSTNVPWPLVTAVYVSLSVAGYVAFFSYVIGGVSALIAAAAFFRCQEHMTPFLNAILAGLLGAIPLVAFTLPNVLDEDVREARSGLHAALLGFGLCGFASLFSALCLQLINRRWPPRDPRDAPATRP
jgi:ABC-type dipeptide/oligopeptide/nickel transport system permease subunit